jgi:16S rRNA (cytosine967-C5)-methyltransferase
LKFHKVIIEKIIEALVQILTTPSYADKVIERHLKANKKWGSRDRKLFAETVYDIVRFRRKYWNLADMNDSDFLKPEKVSEFEIWKMWVVYILDRGWQIPGWLYEDYEYIVQEIPEDLLSEGTDIQEITKTFPFQIRQSYPDWLYDYFKDQLKDEADPLLRALNVMATTYLRVNTLKTTPKELVQILEKEGVNARQIRKIDSALELVERKNVFMTKSFKDGFFEVQDVSSQLIGELVEVEPGMRVADACAGAGGKSLHLATLMKNKGKVISLDLHEWKLKELRQRATRNSIDIIEVKVIESLKTIKRLENSFDRVLLDVPCSGSGVIRRNPDKKWKLSMEEIERLKVLQYEILSQYKDMMKENGKLVYATCSVFPDENERQVQRFLAENKNWKLEKEIKIYPHIQGFDGFYGARLVKSTDS